MAANPVPIDALKAATMKAAAGKAATEAPTANSQSNAVQQDLAVMADLSKGYSAGAMAGNVVAEQNRQAQSGRLAQERAQADAARSRALGMERLQGDLAQAQMASQQQRDALELAAAERARDETAKKVKSGEAVSEEEIERRQADAAKVDIELAASTNIDTQEAFGTIWDLSDSPENAMRIFDNLMKDPEQAAVWAGVNRDVLKAMITAKWDALDGKGFNAGKTKQKATKGVRGVVAGGVRGSLGFGSSTPTSQRATLTPQQANTEYQQIVAALPSASPEERRAMLARAAYLNSIRR